MLYPVSESSELGEGERLSLPFEPKMISVSEDGCLVFTAGWATDPYLRSYLRRDGELVPVAKVRLGGVCERLVRCGEVLMARVRDNDSFQVFSVSPTGGVKRTFRWSGSVSMALTT